MTRLDRTEPWIGGSRRGVPRGEAARLRGRLASAWAAPPAQGGPALPPVLAAFLTPSLDAAGFALRTTAASLVALYVAFLMDMEDPKWAAMTVWIVAQPTRGMSLSKARYRVMGTLAGIVVGVALIALFAQTPELFLPALALWIGVCTGAAARLRNFRAYGAVLAGYTAAIIAMDAAGSPEHVFDIAVARGSYILLGIAVEGTMAAVLAPGSAAPAVMRRLRALLGDAARISREVMAAGPQAPPLPAIRKLLSDALALETAAEYAASESARVRRGLGHIRGAAALAQLAEAQAIGEHRARREPGQSAASLLARAAALFERVPLTLEQSPGRLRDEARALRAEIRAASHDPAQAPDGFLLDRLSEALAALGESLDRLEAPSVARPRPTQIRFLFHTDPVAAWRNGLRAAVAVLLAAAVWIATAWPAGGGFVTIVAVVCALFATRDNPVIGTLAFFRGAAYAIIAAAACHFVLLPEIDGFPLLAAVLSLFLIPGGLALRNPATAGTAAGFTIFVLDLVGPQNTGRSDPVSFLNGSLALLGGIAAAAIVFGVVLPADAAGARRRLLRAIASDLEAMARRTLGLGGHAWHMRMADRAVRQANAAASLRPDQAGAGLEAALAAVRIGDGLLRLQATLADQAIPPAGTRAIRVVLARFGQLSHRPAEAARAARLAGDRLARLAARGGHERASAAALARIADELGEIALAMERHGAALGLDPARAGRPGGGVRAAT